MYIILIHFILLKDTTRAECVWGRERTGAIWWERAHASHSYVWGHDPLVASVGRRADYVISQQDTSWAGQLAVVHRVCCVIRRPHRETHVSPSGMSADYDRDLLLHTPYNVPILLEHAVVCSDSQDQNTPTQNTYT